MAAPHSNDPEINHLPVYTVEELALRNGQEGQPTWTAFQGVIYDVSASPLFQNGKHFRHLAGQDLTSELEKAPHTDRVFEAFLAVGRLVN